MEIGNQIKKYRTELKLSQDDLAEKVFVTRQIISNWENNRNYPDVRSLVLLSNVFGVSLDELEKNQEIGKRPYQIVMLVLLTTVIGLIIVISLRKLFFNF